MTVTLDLNQPIAESSKQARRILDDISLAVAKSKRIVVVTGAGISCSCGIPDFRSSDGLYALVKQQYPDVVLKGRDLFDASLFRDSTSTSVFYTFISQLKRSIDAAHPAETHRFIEMLDKKQKLLRSYTQNIDGFEERLGLCGSSSEGVKTSTKGKSKLRLKDVRNVQLHGDIHRVRCTLCSANLPFTEEYLDIFQDGSAPHCPECISRSNARVARSARPIKVGTLRPAIVLYDEAHPLGDEIGTIQTKDMTRKPDLLVVMGTSLKVHGLKRLVKDFAKVVHDNAPSSQSTSKAPSNPLAGKVIFVNKTPPAGEWADVIDYHVAGDTDGWVKKVCDDWRKMIPKDWEIQTTLEDTASWSVTKNSIGKVETSKGKSKRSHDAENNPTRGRKNQPTAPTSPSKRRTTANHYSAQESSPSKRQAAEVPSTLMDTTAAKRLFSDTTNSPTKERELDLESCEVNLPKPKARRRNQSITKKSGTEFSAMLARKPSLDCVMISTTPRRRKGVV
ncbi:DHS-like NAD/FAD-binding domain-containing protein [Coniophora puteana RWD-64-598 SS2]|uniref:DHS-like NAD/FAD-binding domain-containing protein n=1 Tax=Coniophora puteana (strain RWD-64-598) TaxID=741705 RepID=A0A5M3N8A0_CONPW|nr:DHS-like NAD/FAD-binding domain-containing protein [Coniophora puteana RWD-64-598 SS2]EIW87065.1 DHS-like NAD/FAD-binding domain-containing protein [Coniophora puteana RWD-64-598 SS2]